MNCLEYDYLLISCDLIMDQAWELLKSLPPDGQLNQVQNDECTKLISELKDSVGLMETLRTEYRQKLENSQHHYEGVRGYAQSQSLNASQPKGDIYHAQ